MYEIKDMVIFSCLDGPHIEETKAEKAFYSN